MGQIKEIVCIVPVDTPGYKPPCTAIPKNCVKCKKRGWFVPYSKAKIKRKGVKLSQCAFICIRCTKEVLEEDKEERNRPLTEQEQIAENLSRMRLRWKRKTVVPIEKITDGSDASKKTEQPQITLTALNAENSGEQNAPTNTQEDL